MQALRGGEAETGEHIVFTCEEGKDLRKEVWIEPEATTRSWRSWQDLDSGSWTLGEKGCRRQMDYGGSGLRVHVQSQADLESRDKLY